MLFSCMKSEDKSLKFAFLFVNQFEPKWLLPLKMLQLVNTCDQLYICKMKGSGNTLSN